MQKSEDSISRQDFLANLKNNVITLTPSRRLASSLNREAAGKDKVWETHPVYPLAEFIGITLEHAAFSGVFPLNELPGRILEPVEEQIIWETIINKSSAPGPLSNCSEIARQARKAWQLLQEWCVKPDAVDNSFEFKQLKSWIEQYIVICQNKDVTDQTTLFKKFCASNVKLINANKIQLAGFAEISPLLKKFIKNLTKHDIQVLFLNDTEIAKNIYRTEFSEINAEIAAMASWCAKVIRQNPQAKIAVAVPELATYREKIIKALNLHLQLDKYVLDNPDNSEKFNVSLGAPLIRHSMVKNALSLLELILNKTGIDYQLVSIILTSRYFYQEAIADKAKFDVFFREHAQPETSLSQLVNLIRLKYLEQLPDWAKGFIKLLAERPKGKKTLKVWASIFSNCLEIAGFAQSEDKSFIEHQLLVSLDKAFASFAKLTTVDNLVSASDALRLLNKLCTTSIFQVESSHTVNIEVLGELEASSQTFDYLWFIGADNNTLPRQARPNPLLPLRLQKAKEMPHSSAELTLKSALELIKQLKTNAPSIIFSSCKLKNGKDVLPSSLTREFPLRNFTTVDNLDEPKEDLETISDHYGAAKPYGKLKSGIKFLHDQAVCPLMAYAIHRLGAKKPPIPQGIFSPLNRGQIIHKTLEKLYTNFKTQDSLRHITDLTLVDNISEVLETFGLKKTLIGQNALQLEKARILSALHNFLELEKERDAFTINNLELPLGINLAGYKINIRIDRIDSLSENSFLLIDYKTGVTNKNGWFDARLSEPQLPLYALNIKNTSAIAFAEVKPGAAKIKYLGKQKITNGRSSFITADNWQRQLNTWQSRLNSLAKEINAGFAVLLLDYPDVVYNSDARGFCRLQEQR